MKKYIFLFELLNLFICSDYDNIFICRYSHYKTDELAQEALNNINFH